MAVSRAYSLREVAASDLSGGINKVLRPELLYKTYRIRLLSKLQMDVYYLKVLILINSATGTIGITLYDGQAFLKKEEMDLRALKLDKQWLDKQGA